ncbi:MAG TPA: hypothetical protein VI759_07320 [Dehalococcoidia bacterium]|nr:hypothetical protein [Dehalococcoidia bacterium]
MHAANNTLEVSAPGRAAAARHLDARLLAEIDVRDPGLSEQERLRRLVYARKAYYAKLALASVKARRKKAGAK